MSISLPTRRLVSQQDSAMIERPDIPRSRFTGSWTRKSTFDAGVLIPILVDEILPGDHMSYNVTAYIRMSTPLFPMFDSQRVDTHFFFVPNRILWDNWERFMGQQDSPGDSTIFTIPQVTSTATGFLLGGIGDHFGLPVQPQTLGVLSVSALPWRAYFRIWSEWFRDENLQNSFGLYAGDATADEVAATYVLLPRNKSHDYFTSALPWTQKPIGTFAAAPSVPLTGSFPVKGLGFKLPGVAGPGGTMYESIAGAGIPAYGFVNADLYAEQFNPGGVGHAIPNIRVDTSGAGMLINDLRLAFLVQQLLERDARGGTRYTELVASHFGVRSPDARLQRPEYIGGGSSAISITPVAQTAPGGSLPVGALGGAGTAVGSHRASYAATEHGYIIGVMSVRSELSYSQGVSRHWSRRTRPDFYFPALAGLGEQAILKQELYADGTGQDTTAFGYQERWHEYRTRVSEVTGLFRPGVTGTLAPWHLSQQLTNFPYLGDTFLRDTPPMARVLAAGAADAGKQYLADILFQRQAVRPVPVYGTPAMLGRF